MMVYLFAGSEVAASSWEQCHGELAALGVPSTAVSYDLSDWEHGYDEAISRLAARVTPGSVLVGHSLAGLFLPVLGESIGAAAEIYLAALAPEPQTSFTEQVFNSREEVFTGEWSQHYGGTTSLAEGRVQELLFGDCPPGSAARFRRPPQNLSLLYDLACPLASLPPRRRHYIVCARDRTIAPDWQRYAARRWLGVEPVSLDAGHLPQISAPRRLAGLMADLLAGDHRIISNSQSSIQNTVFKESNRPSTNLPRSNL